MISTFSNSNIECQAISINAIIQCAVGDARFARPFAQCLAIISNVIALVILLLALGSPSAVLGHVVPIDINAIQTVSASGASTHVSQEIFIVVPSLANSNISTTIPMEITRVGIITPVPHPQPCFIFWSNFTAWDTTFTMSQAKFTRYFPAKTSTGFSVAAGKITREYNDCDATIAFTKPCSMFTSVRSTSNCDKASESLIWFHEVKE